MNTLDSVLKSIKNKNFSPVYFFHGEEPYPIDLAVEALEEGILTEDEKAFNQTIIYGKDSSFLDILALARQFPMMGDKQVIIVKEAQQLRLGEAEVEAFIHYLQNPVESTILIFAHKNGKLDSRKRKLNDLLKKNNFLHESPKIKDYELPKFIQQIIANLGIKTTPSIPLILAEYLGNDLSKTHNELTKIQLILKPNEIFDEKLAEKHIGISKDYNIFELQKALGTKNLDSALKIAYFISKKPDIKSFLIPALSNLYTYFSNIILFHTLAGKPSAEIASQLKINAFFIKDYQVAAANYPLKHATRIISILREIDMKNKGLGANQTPSEELLIELVYKILNIDKIKV